MGLLPWESGVTVNMIIVRAAGIGVGVTIPLVSVMMTGGMLVLMAMGTALTTTLTVTGPNQATVSVLVT